MAHVNTPFVGNIAQGDGQDSFVFGSSPDVSGHESFVNSLADADTIVYIAKHLGKAEWEVGLGTWDEDATTLARTTVYRSSAGGTTKETFSGGNVEVTSAFGLGSTDWTITNPGATRSFSGAESTAATIAAALALLINDLTSQGVLK